MSEEVEIRLSSKWTVLSMILILLLFLILLPIIWFRQQSMGLEFMVVLSDIILIVVFGFFIYLFIHVCTARIADNKLILQKLIGRKRVFSFDQVEKVSSITMRATRYVFVKVKNESSRIETFIILNAIHMIPRRDSDAEVVINNHIGKNISIR